MDDLQIFVQAEGKRGIQVIELPPNAKVQDLVRAVFHNGVHDGGNAVAVYEENVDTALPANETLVAAGLGNLSSVHIARCTRVAVTAHYNGQERSERFGPGVPMHRVKDWVVGKTGFDLGAVDAAEHVLQITGTTDRPDEDVHIGSLVGENGCSVEFDLVPKVRVEG